MAKYKVVASFKNKDTKTWHKADEEIELTVKRADEINKAMAELKKADVTVERIKEDAK